MNNDLKSFAYTKVHVDASMRFPNPQGRKGIEYSLLAEFSVKDQDGNTQFLRFKDNRGNAVSLIIPKGGLDFDLTDPVQERNYKVLKARLAADPDARKVIKIHDENIDIEKAIEEEDAKIEVKVKLKELRDSGNSEMLRNLYRRKHGTVAGKTDEVIYKSLLIAVDENTSEIQSLLEDEDGDLKSLLAKAVEANILKIENGFYMNAAGTGLAEGESQMVYNLKKDPEYKDSLQRMVSQHFEDVKSRTPMSRLQIIEAKQVINKDIADSLQFKEENENPEDDGANDGDKQAKYTPEQIRKAVAKAVTGAYFDKKGNVFTIEGRNGEFLRADLDKYYTNPDNGKEAEILVEKMSNSA